MSTGGYGQTVSNITQPSIIVQPTTFTFPSTGTNGPYTVAGTAWPPIALQQPSITLQQPAKFALDLDVDVPIGSDGHLKMQLKASELQQDVLLLLLQLLTQHKPLRDRVLDALTESLDK